MATHSSILAWTISWTEEPGGLSVHGVARSQTQLSYFHHPLIAVKLFWRIHFHSAAQEEGCLLGAARPASYLGFSWPHPEAPALSWAFEKFHGETFVCFLPLLSHFWLSIQLCQVYRVSDHSSICFQLPNFVGFCSYYLCPCGFTLL